MHDSIVVYTSEADRLRDQWLWNDGGWLWIVGIAVAVILAAIIGHWWEDRKHRKR